MVCSFESEKCHISHFFLRTKHSIVCHHSHRMSIEVGLEFFKYFPTYGVYRGIVVCVSDLEDDDGTRSRWVRCIYEDGDEEDIEFEKMQKLLQRQKEIIAKKFKSNSKKKNCSNRERKSDETVYKEGSSGSKKEIKSSLVSSNK